MNTHFEKNTLRGSNYTFLTLDKGQLELLISYNTIIAMLDKRNGIIYITNKDVFSQTTHNHLKNALILDAKEMKEVKNHTYLKSHYGETIKYIDNLSNVIGITQLAQYIK